MAEPDSGLLAPVVVERGQVLVLPQQGAQLAMMADELRERCEDDPRCEFCDRSVIARFGGSPSGECAACADEFSYLARAGKVFVGFVGFEGSE